MLLPAVWNRAYNAATDSSLYLLDLEGADMMDCTKYSVLLQALVDEGHTQTADAIQALLVSRGVCPRPCPAQPPASGSLAERLQG